MTQGKRPDSQTLTIPAVDGYPLHARIWRQSEAAAPVVIINPATSVLSRYYSRFASYLHSHGFHVVCYDYRGIGDSRPQQLRHFQANWLDWGGQDFEGVLRYVIGAFPDSPIQLVAHSVGGLLVGLAPSSHRIERVFAMGSQFAYWPDYAANRRVPMYLRWHIVMPIITALFGYFPGKRLGWLEDTPTGIVQDWNAATERLEQTWKNDARLRTPEQQQALVAQYGRVAADWLAFTVTDDPFGTEVATHRLLDYYRGSNRQHLRLDPAQLDGQGIGHFAYFHARYADSLWPVALQWLQEGTLVEAVPGQRWTFLAGQGAR
ncbi:alpha/beta hydrolase family protein [Brachymonas sp. J145]|uniref:alpha/beta hydrolase family protein n=1 Tax=Brachymonas sp. J145 TaxID=3116489 RepID=UPI002E7867C2|nr:alpha/beta fold hydrolase [Brachymonas sp. J145]MEE1652974.1 alpha/beta fold hydrolase [Brachymonas sp. J145]